MNTIWTIISREYLTRVKKKSFIFLTLLVPIGYGLLIFLPIWLSNLETGQRDIAVLDQSGLAGLQLEGSSTYRFSYIDNSTLDGLKDNYKQMDFDGILYIPPIDIERPLGIKYYSDEQPGAGVIKFISSQLEKQIETMRFAAHGYDLEKIKELWVDLDIDSIVLGKEGEKSANLIVSSILSQVMGFILYFALFMYGSMIMRGVMEEKRSRIMEIMASTVRPFQLMMGKIIGIAAVAMTQLLTWSLLIVLISSVAGSMFLPDTINQSQMAQLSGDAAVPMTDAQEILAGVLQLNYVHLISMFLLFFLFGYLMYSALFAAVGSVISENQDNNSVALPVTLPIILSILLMVQVVKQPHGPLALWSSMIPLFSPIVMTARLPFDVPLWQSMLSLGLLIASFVGTTWMAAKIYRTGILLYGKKVTLREMLRWLFTKA